MKMHNLICLSALLLLFFISTARGNTQKAKIADAKKAAIAWLNLTDTKEYDESWEDAAPILKSAITKKDWAKKIAAVREPMGKLLKRKVISAKYLTEIPGAPDGEYVVIQFQTSMKNKKSAVETVTPMISEGKWKVSGYYIK